MRVALLTVNPDKMVDQAIGQPPFQAVNPDSSLWLNQMDQRWADLQAGSDTGGSMAIGVRRVSDPVRYATSPIVIAAWESVGPRTGLAGSARGLATDPGQGHRGRQLQVEPSQHQQRRRHVGHPGRVLRRGRADPGPHRRSRHQPGHAGLCKIRRGHHSVLWRRRRGNRPTSRRRRTQFPRRLCGPRT